jgi:hypothetical protein
MPVDLSKFEGMTPGPWLFRKFGLCGNYGCRPIVLDADQYEIRVGHRSDAMGGLMVPLYPEHPDAAAIEATPDLIAEVRELRAERDRLLKAVQEAHRKLSLKKDGRGRCACVYCEVQAAKA